MLRKTSFLGFASAALLLTFGCGKSNDSTTSNQTAPAPASVAGPTAEQSAAYQAKATVSEFLDAVRKRDDEKAQRMLTKIARESLGKTGFAVGPAVSDTTKIEIDEPKFRDVDHDIADVPVRLIDVDELGKPQTFQAVWVCRLESDGWRIGGLMANIFDDEQPWTFDFEKPEELAQKQQLLKDELARRAKAEVVPHSTGESTTQAQATPKDAFRR